MRLRGLTVLGSAAPPLHWLALALGVGAVVCGLQRMRGRARAVASVTGVVMLAAMTDMAAGTMLLGRWTPLAWTAALLAAGIAAAWAGRPAVVGAAGGNQAAREGDTDPGPLHLLHVTCLPVMAALTAAMAQHATVRTTVLTGPHHHGDVFTAFALVAAAVHVAAGCSVTVGRRRRRLDRVEALAGAGAVAAMAGAAML